MKVRKIILLLIDRQHVSQYKEDYTKKEANCYSSNQDSVSLRKTNFILGDHKSLYTTTHNDQNRNVDPRGRPVTALSSTAKSDLRKSHFSLGNYNPNFTTSSKSEFTDKGCIKGMENSNDIGKILRKHNHVLGNSEPEFKSEMHARFLNPNQCGAQKQLVSTAELQKNHYVFGSNNDPWRTTSQLSYGTKTLPDYKLHSKNLSKTNFILGQDQPEMKSISHQTYVPHKSNGFSQMNKDLSNDLRQHHFKMGNDEPNLMSINHQDFQALSSGDKYKPTIDHLTLKKSHFSLGDKSQELKDHYDTTYNKAMTNRMNAFPERASNLNNKSSVIIKEDTNTNYMSESRSK